MYVQTPEHVGVTESFHVYVFSSALSLFSDSKEKFSARPDSATDMVFRLSAFAKKGLTLEVHPTADPLLPVDTSISSLYTLSDLADPLSSTVPLLNNLDNEVWPNLEKAPSDLKLSFLTEFEVPESLPFQFIDDSIPFLEPLALPNDRSIIIIKLAALNPYPTPVGLGFGTEQPNCKAIFGIVPADMVKGLECGIIYSKYNRITGAVTEENEISNTQIIYITGYKTIPKDTIVQIWLGGFFNFESNIKINIEFLVKRKNIFNFFLQSEQIIPILKFQDIDTTAPSCKHLFLLI